MNGSRLIKWAVIGACLPLFVGCVERQVVYRDRPVPGPAPVVVEEVPAPPPPQREVIAVAPGPLSVWFWAPGCWEWRGRWVWTGGHWIARPHSGAVWVGAHWDRRGGHRVWVHGGWR
jgi:hypothetical protein